MFMSIRNMLQPKVSHRVTRYHGVVFLIHLMGVYWASVKFPDPGNSKENKPYMGPEFKFFSLVVILM